jgi:hypothetical protein
MVYFVAIWNILWSFGIFPRFGILYREKSGSPAADPYPVAAFVPTKVGNRTVNLNPEPEMKPSLDRAVAGEMNKKA